MATEKTPFELAMKGVVLIKPSKPTPFSVLHLSSLDHIPDLNTLCHTLHVYRSKVDDHDEPSCPNHQLLHPADVIKAALSKALFYYYPLAGRLVDHTDGKLVTNFPCGGFTIGMGLLHSVCDGVGAFQFFKAIMEFARGKTEPSVKPVWERDRLTGSITKNPLQIDFLDEASAAVSPFLPTKVLMHQCIKVDSESIRRLKMSLMKESGENENFTTFESLAAYVWRSKCRALKMSYDGKVKLIITVGVRRHLQDPLPEGYYGNVVVDAYVVLTMRELNERPLYEIVKLIKESKKVSCNSDYVRNFMNTLETDLEKELMNFNVEGSGALTTLTDWRHLDFENVDFGVKEIVNVVPMPSDMFGCVDLCIFSALGNFDSSMEGGVDFGVKEIVNVVSMPSDMFGCVDLCIFSALGNFDSSMEGGVGIFVSLPAPALLTFKEEMEALSVLI
ncbi:shikimate O-hydroxycinnamoyltransferase [Vigna unguiculata]|uniref:Shikimate O-hydroxycinnamoyltransferase n=1 Tax=Vigna unguiculata TaxID=3917 RepID=A0A4D6KQC1_VIGUN|nr:shikimate O-hydroxycinnamoyltransferase [Vigna unguiculata]